MVYNSFMLILPPNVLFIHCFVTIFSYFFKIFSYLISFHRKPKQLPLHFFRNGSCLLRFHFKLKASQFFFCVCGILYAFDDQIIANLRIHLHMNYIAHFMPEECFSNR